MGGSLDEVIDRVKLREVAGVFHSYDALDAAADDLLQSGFDRADIDVIGDLRVAQRRVGGVYVAPEELADVSLVPRRPYMRREEVAVATSVVSGVLAAAGGLAVTYDIVASGGRAGLALGAAAVAALAAGGVAVGFMARRLGRKTPAGME